MTGTVTKDDRDKAERKQVPASIRGWMSEVNGVRRFVQMRPQLKDDMGIAWLTSMQRYYRARLMLLMRKRPEGLSRDRATAEVKPLLDILPD